MKEKTMHLMTDLMLGIVFFIYWSAGSLMEGNQSFAVSGIVLAFIIFAVSYITTPVSDRIMAKTAPMKTYRKAIVYFMMLFVCFLAFTAFYAGMSYIAMYVSAVQNYMNVMTPALFILMIGAVLLIVFMTPVIHTILYTAVLYFTRDRD
ncbi:MAG: hypothetical protein IJ130_10050 [Solobacterium sp.]|nr:hypothetical protein [Solobacterium sp.]